MITNQNVSKIYLGPIDQTQTISFDIPYISSSYLQLTVVEEDGSQSEPLRETTDYVVTPVYVEGLIDGATIQLTGTVVISDKQRLAVERVTPLTQETDFPENGEFESNSIERALDKGTMIAQEIKAKDARNISANILESSEFNSEIPLSSDETRMLTINNTGIGISDVSVDDITTSMNNAEASAQAAKQSETNAKASETAAAQSAASALASQNAAEQAKTDTQAIADKALQDIGTAKTDAVNTINTEEAEAVETIDTGKKEIQEIVDQIKYVPTMSVCDIGMSIFIDETKGLRRWLNGQVVAINTNTQAFLTRLKQIKATSPSLFTTEENWQAEKLLSAYGQVGKFVIANDESTVRIPAVVNVQGLLDLQNLGLRVDAGLPNIEGGFGSLNNSLISPTGCFKFGQTDTRNQAGNTVIPANEINFDASLSNPIYGKSDTVQPEAIQYPYFIQIATGQETKAEIINTLELNNPYTLFDCKYSETKLYNIAWLRSEGQWNSKATHPKAYEALLVEQNADVADGTTVELPSGTSYTKRGVSGGISAKLSTEEYDDYDFVVKTSDETFRLPIKSKLASGKAVVGNGDVISLVKLNSGEVKKLRQHHTTNYDYLQASPTDNSAFDVGGNPQGTNLETGTQGLYLYFYVGETVQNANLINAGRIEEKLVDINSRPYITETYQNGTSGYIVYSNGLCEQWGVQSAAATGSETTIELLKPYKDINYIALKTFSISTSTQAFYRYISIYSKTVNNFKTGNTSGIENWSWFTKGYIS